MAFAYISIMNFIGYIKPYNKMTYTIPVYSDGKKHFYHKLSQDFKIEKFEAAAIGEMIILTDDLLPRLSSQQFNIGDNGLVIFIDHKWLPNIGTVNEIEAIIRPLADGYQSALKEINND